MSNFAEAVMEIERLRDIVQSIQHLVQNAEVVVLDGVGMPYMPRIVYAQDLQDVLDGKLRV